MSCIDSTLQFLRLDMYDPRSYNEANSCLNQTTFPRVTPSFCGVENGAQRRGSFRNFSRYVSSRDTASNMGPRKVTVRQIPCLIHNFYKAECLAHYTYLGSLGFSRLLWIVRRKEHYALEVVPSSALMIIAIVTAAIACEVSRMILLETSL